MERNRKRNQLPLVAVFAGALALATITLVLRHAHHSEPKSGRDATAPDSLARAIEDAPATPSWASTPNLESRLSSLSLSDECEQILGAYEERGDCLLAGWGYLDIQGNVWSCMVDGGSWVDVCYVEARPSGGCEVRVMHIDAEELEQSWRASGGGAT